MVSSYLLGPLGLVSLGKDRPGCCADVSLTSPAAPLPLGHAWIRESLPVGTRPPHSRTRAPALRFSQPSTVPELWLCLWDKLTKCVWRAAVSTAATSWAWQTPLLLSQESFPSCSQGIVSLRREGRRLTLHWPVTHTDKVTCPKPRGLRCPRVHLSQGQLLICETRKPSECSPRHRSAFFLLHTEGTV